MAVAAIRVIGAAMADVGVVGIGRLTMGWRERMVMVDPRGSEMVLITLRAADEVRVPQFTKHVRLSARRPRFLDRLSLKWLSGIAPFTHCWRARQTARSTGWVGYGVYSRL